MILNKETISNLSFGIKKKTTTDLTLLCLLNICMFILFTRFDVSEVLLDFIESYEHYELDEIIPLLLTFVISIFVFTVRRFLELKELFIEIEQVSVRDHLTGLYNRRCMQEKFEYIVKGSKRESKNYSAFIVDIDDFKKVNDTLGHNVGDKVLIQFAQILLASTREIDIVSRWGGEEFLILCPNTNLNEAISAAQRILIAIRNYKHDDVGHLTASIGVVIVNENESFIHVVNRVDKCLYEAKNSGKDCYVAN